MNKSQLNLWNPKMLEVLGNILLPKRGEEPVATTLAKQLKSLVTGTSAYHVCYQVGDEEQRGCLYGCST